MFSLPPGRAVHGRKRAPQADETPLPLLAYWPTGLGVAILIFPRSWSSHYPRVAFVDAVLGRLGARTCVPSQAMR